MLEVCVNNKIIKRGNPTYFIADIGANHDGNLDRAVELIHLAKEAGADAAKFQHFKAESIVSQKGFDDLEGKQSHQSSWSKSVFEVYQGASISDTWTETLVNTCKSVGIDFFTSPYNMDAIDMIDPFVPAYKVGSGDITWHDIVRKMASKGKPVLVAAGASTMEEVDELIQILKAEGVPYGLMQCNTNYTGAYENFNSINLNVLRSFELAYPEVPLGLSDHTIGHSTVLGAVALGACMIEKHFTDDTRREGPDHHFAMDPRMWREMVDATRELELALGDGIKRVEENEKDTVVVQRRSIRASREIAVGEVISHDNTEVLRPAPIGSLTPAQFDLIEGKASKVALAKGDVVTLQSVV